jgi:hypothetical protein
LEASDPEFYDLNPPTYLQQGDILVGVPFLFLPRHEELILLREAGKPIDMLSHRKRVELIREMAAGDAFDQPEYVAVSARRSHAVLMTQTCDLVDSPEYLVCPMEKLEGSGVDAGNLRAAKYVTLFGLPETSYFPESLIDFTKLRAVSREAIAIKDRIAALTRTVQLNLSERFARSLGRDWGHAPGDAIPTSGKYRCLRCTKFDVPLVELAFEAGMLFPECEHCKRQRKQAQWHLLLPWKKRT